LKEIIGKLMFKYKQDATKWSKISLYYWVYGL